MLQDLPLGHLPGRHSAHEGLVRIQEGHSRRGGQPILRVDHSASHLRIQVCTIIDVDVAVAPLIACLAAAVDVVATAAVGI